MTVSMLALAGIPATAGFTGKFYLIDAAISGGYTWLGVVIVIGSMISLGYYLPVLAAMWMRAAPSGAAGRGGPPGPGDAPASGGEALPTLAGGSPELDLEPLSAGHPPRSGAAGTQPEVALVAILAGVGTIFFGIIPEPLFQLVHGSGAALGLF